MKTISIIMITLGLFACAEDPTDVNELPADKKVLFDNLASGTHSGDPFQVHRVKRTGNELLVEVGFSGGCAEHDFELIWDETIDTSNQRPSVKFALMHNANGDMCEAYLQKTLRFDLKKRTNKSLSTNQYDAQVFNAYNSLEYFMSYPTMNIAQGVACAYSVELQPVICGTGVFNNRWFLTKDENLMAIDEPFYFQPVVYEPDDVPANGDYTVGVRILKNHPVNAEQVVCMAYPGYSVPVAITCIEPSGESR